MDMGKNKSDSKKKKKKSSQLVIRIEASERDAFVKRCNQLDTTAAREIRRFMREWVAINAPPAETEATSEPLVEAAPEPSETPAPVEAVTKAKPARRKRQEPVEADA
jgi:hypothetical protein